MVFFLNKPCNVLCYVKRQKKSFKKLSLPSELWTERGSSASMFSSLISSLTEVHSTTTKIDSYALGVSCLTVIHSTSGSSAVQYITDSTVCRSKD